MDITVRTHFGYPEVLPSIRQMEDAYGAELARLATSSPAFEAMSKLFVSPQTRHPVYGPPLSGRRTYHKPTSSYYSDAVIDYSIWAPPRWAERVDAFADAVGKAVKRIAKTRITHAERARLLEHVETARLSVREAPPDSVVRVEPIYLRTDGAGAVMAVTGAAPPVGAADQFVTKVEPENAQSVAGRADHSANPTVSTFKLYRRDEGRFLYREAWPVESGVVEHWGVCGERGDVREHAAEGDHAKADVIAELKRQAKALGFRPIPPSRSATLVVEYPLDGRATGQDLDHRHEIEDQLDELIGWLGLGHCDGGSAGSGTMEIFLIVVDFVAAKSVLERELGGVGLGGFSRIYRMK